MYSDKIRTLGLKQDVEKAIIDLLNTFDDEMFICDLLNKFIYTKQITIEQAYQIIDILELIDEECLDMEFWR